MWAEKHLYVLPLQLAAQKAPPQSPPQLCLSCPLPTMLSHHSSLVTSLGALSRTLDAIIYVPAPHGPRMSWGPPGCRTQAWTVAGPPKNLPFALPLSFLSLLQSRRSLSGSLNIPAPGSSTGPFCRECSSVTRQYASLPHLLRVAGTCLTTLYKIITPTTCTRLPPLLLGNHHQGHQAALDWSPL